MVGNGYNIIIFIDVGWWVGWRKWRNDGDMIWIMCFFFGGGYGNINEWFVLMFWWCIYIKVNINELLYIIVYGFYSIINIWIYIYYNNFFIWIFFSVEVLVLSYLWIK